MIPLSPDALHRGFFLAFSPGRCTKKLGEYIRKQGLKYNVLQFERRCEFVEKNPDRFDSKPSLVLSKTKHGFQKRNIIFKPATNETGLYNK